MIIELITLIFGFSLGNITGILLTLKVFKPKLYKKIMSVIFKKRKKNRG